MRSRERGERRRSHGERASSYQVKRTSKVCKVGQTASERSPPRDHLAPRSDHLTSPRPLAGDVLSHTRVISCSSVSPPRPSPDHFDARQSILSCLQLSAAASSLSTCVPAHRFNGTARMVRQQPRPVRSLHSARLCPWHGAKPRPSAHINYLSRAAMVRRHPCRAPFIQP